jgi:hypothetical protein
MILFSGNFVNYGKPFKAAKPSKPLVGTSAVSLSL